MQVHTKHMNIHIYLHNYELTMIATGQVTITMVCIRLLTASLHHFPLQNESVPNLEIIVSVSGWRLM